MLRPVAETVPSPSLARRCVVEGLGTALLLAVVVGSGIMAERLAGGNSALALLANSAATGAGLLALIAAFGPFSGAHFNPLVTVADALLGRRPWREVPPYSAAQIVGAFVGAAAAGAMFGEPIFRFAEKSRDGVPLAFAESIATFGLLAVIFASDRRTFTELAVAVGAYISAAYWFTSSTSFANPAVTLARSVTNTFTGIRPADVPGFLLGQALGLFAFVSLARRLWLDTAPIDEARSTDG